MSTITEERKKSIAEWDARNTIQVKMKLHKINDADVIEKLNSVGQKQTYIKALIRADIAKGGK